VNNRANADGRISKKQFILDYREAHGLAEAGVRELRLIQQELRQRLAAQPSLSYIAGVLRQAGAQINYEDRYTGPAIPPAYAGRLQGVLHFRDLATAEDALRKLDGAYRDYELAGDRSGMQLVRKLVLHGKKRAGSLAGNARVNEAKRREKGEIANWFRVWLESRSLFFEWLEIRKQTEEFERMLPGENPSEASGSVSKPREK